MGTVRAQGGEPVTPAPMHFSLFDKRAQWTVGELMAVIERAKLRARGVECWCGREAQA